MPYDDLKADLRGVAFTNPTPFTEDATTVRHDALANNLEYIAEAGGNVILPCGNTGEYYSLSREERVAVVETTVETVGDRMTVAGGVGGSTKDACSLAEAYEEAGADALLVMHPVHTYVHAEGVAEYYRRLAEATDLGLVLYKRGPELPDRVIADLSSVDNVVAVKYAVNDVKAFAALVRDTPGDIVFSNGIAERYGPSFGVEGAEGYTTGIGNFVPEASLALMDAIRAEDWDRAREIRDVFRPYEDLREEAGLGNDPALTAANNVPAVKFGMELAGLAGGPVREPIVGLSEADEARVREYYEALSGIER